jgi:uncharacterized protein
MASRSHFIFAHGAGAGQGSAWMQHWAELLRELGTVQLFDYPYMAAGRRSPDRLPLLVDAHRAQLLEARQNGHRQLVLIGKSMGSRVACHLALELEVEALVCLGYPLKAPGASGKLRDEVLLKLERPVLFVQGTRDPLCPLDVLAAVRARMKARNELFTVEAGDHSLLVTKTGLARQGATQATVDRAVLQAIEAFSKRELAA